MFLEQLDECCFLIRWPSNVSFLQQFFYVWLCIYWTQQVCRTSLNLCVCHVGEVLQYLSVVSTVSLQCFTISTVLFICPSMYPVKSHFLEDLCIFGMLMLRIRFDTFEYIIHLLSNLCWILSLYGVRYDLPIVPVLLDTFKEHLSFFVCP